MQLFLLLLIIIINCSIGVAQEIAKKNFLFAYFKGNGEDGLHLAHSTDGYTWIALNNDQSFLRPTAGKDKLMRDPSICQGPDGMFHMVWTVSWGEKGIGYASSKDLVNWSEQRYIPVMEHESNAQNCWAPELFYDRKTKTYYIYWATTIPGRFAKGDDQKYNHRLYYTSTKDFITYSPTALLYDPSFSVIDAFIVKSGKKYVMFLKDETDKPNTPEKKIRIATSHSPRGPYTSAGKSITGNYWAEGPSVILINKKWFVYFDKYMEKKYGLLTSDNLQTWTDNSDKLATPNGIRHGTVFEVSQPVLKRLNSRVK